MKIVWTDDANIDLVRIDAFLAAIDVRAALRAVDDIYSGIQKLAEYPDLGVEIERFIGRALRKLIIGDYEIRYERTSESIYLLHIWHVREDR